eukprot:CAMPEP_0196651692 /NCGR_PEP_ID=MMETSP1086-20130531/747_1 /TAXON_ID=77921 /ORGANISM="Cyanoptyche  gloeocystis , Strain SAG4.97" /LENGTH=301 /DNA_ID=CAMNT_0041981825 /DNA_START=170 /DNA_END=1075 /DNA_ORIENTATION=+
MTSALVQDVEMMDIQSSSNFSESFDKLPFDLIVKIFGFLDLQSCSKVSQVCQSFYWAAKDEHVWYQQCIQLLGFSTTVRLLPCTNSFRDLYRQFYSVFRYPSSMNGVDPRRPMHCHDSTNAHDCMQQGRDMCIRGWECDCIDAAILENLVAFQQVSALYISLWRLDSGSEACSPSYIERVNDFLPEADKVRISYGLDSQAINMPGINDVANPQLLITGVKFLSALLNDGGSLRDYLRRLRYVVVCATPFFWDSSVLDHLKTVVDACGGHSSSLQYVLRGPSASTRDAQLLTGRQNITEICC